MESRFSGLLIRYYARRNGGSIAKGSGIRDNPIAVLAKAVVATVRNRRRKYEFF